MIRTSPSGNKPNNGVGLHVREIPQQSCLQSGENPIIRIQNLPRRSIPRIVYGKKESVREKLSWVHLPQIQIRGTRRIVFVLRMGVIPLVEHQTGALRGKNPSSRGVFHVGEISQWKGFDSRRPAQKDPVGMFALTPPSGRNHICRATD